MALGKDPDAPGMIGSHPVPKPKPRLPGSSFDPTRDFHAGVSNAPISLAEISKWVEDNFPDSGLSELVVFPELQQVVRDAIRYGYRTTDEFWARFQRTKLYTTFFGESQQPALSGGGGGGGGRLGGGGAAGPKPEDYLAAEAAVRNMSHTMGIMLNDDQIRWVARTAVDGNWSNDMLADNLINNRAAYGETQAGSITASADQIKAMGAGQLLAVSDATAAEYSARINSGEMTVDGVASLFQAQAKQYYAWAGDVIDKGVLMRDYLRPSRDMIATELEMNPEDINLMDSKWMNMVQVTSDKGEVRAATMPELQRATRSTDEFKKTTRARQMAESAGLYLRRYFEGG